MIFIKSYLWLLDNWIYRENSLETNNKYHLVRWYFQFKKKVPSSKKDMIPSSIIDSSPHPHRHVIWISSRDSPAQFPHQTSLVHLPCSSRRRMCGFDIEVDLNTTLAFYPPDSSQSELTGFDLVHEKRQKGWVISPGVSTRLYAFADAKDLLSQPE